MRTAASGVQLPGGLESVDWLALDLDPTWIAGCEILQDERRRSVYRLLLGKGDVTSLVLKRSPSGEAIREITFYLDVLPRLAQLPTLKLHGDCAGLFGERWILMEDALGEPYDWRDPCQRRLAGDWLGRLQLLGAQVDLSDLGLRDRGPDHFGEHLVLSRQAIEENEHNPSLTPEHRMRLTALLGLLRAAERAWPDLTTECSSLPQTLVHGDFKPDNLRVRSVGDALELVVFDWTEGGFGLPALDLTRFLATDRFDRSVRNGAIEARFNYAMAPDRKSYLAHACRAYPDLDAALVRRIGLVGDLFRCAATMRWQAERLAYPWVEGPMEHLRYAETWLRYVSEELGW